MCQTYEGERNYMVDQAAWIRSVGYNAQKAGEPKFSNPESDHPIPEYSDKVEWDLGWDTAAAGREHW